MKKISLFITIIALSLSSCSDYLDINTTTNSPLDEAIPARLVLPGAQAQTFRTQAVTLNQLGNVMANQWASNVKAFTGGFTREYTMNIDNTFYSGIWDGIYRNSANFQKIIETKEENQEYYIAIAKIMKAHYLQYIVDLYGDAPYFEAFKGQANLTPAYTNDNGRTIYTELLKELDDARDLIANSPDADQVTTDVMLGGDMDKWAAFANTLELRLLMRQSTATNKVADYNQRLAAVAAGPFVTADVTINPGYSSASDDQQNPFYGANWTDVGGNPLQNYNFLTASGYFADILNGAAGAPTAGLIDGRRGRLFGLVGGKVSGVVQGSNDTQAGCTTPSGCVSRLGAGLTGFAGGTVGEAVANGSSKNGMVMLAAESYFLQAEAAVRYPAIFTGNAKQLFDQGITASFTYLGATPVSLTNYLAGIDTKVGFGWTATADKIECIISQKWIAMSGIHGIEGFIEFTRTGFPKNLPASITNPGGQTGARIKRLIYPQSEYVANSANVPNITIAQAFANGPFWSN